ncbi:hypothetical protein GCM10010399_43830 [Dactylosporangium fulvum]|uniref:Uncharacterized protein n=1 Tax=Dactylosporangium fulvum TaxID=53359 RepID=A0ABY5W9B5_9ACTN|nr:hypothetical protein [Dactylosporangium fulvum]UWP85950.1 hypothetical protein Dfulv_17525 [Dactylosporangium fulvum]
MTAVLARPGLRINEHYVHRSGDLVQAINLPSGRWSVKVREINGQWLGFAVPRGTNPGDPFVLASGAEAEVFGLALRWATSAQTLGGHMNRVVFAGHGDALDELPVDVAGLAVTL